MSIDTQPFTHHNMPAIAKCRCKECDKPANAPYDYCVECWNSCKIHVKMFYEGNNPLLYGGNSNEYIQQPIVQKS